MHYDMPNICPVCTSPLHATKLTCHTCHTSIEGDFMIDPLVRLTQTQRQFAIRFLCNRGNIKLMEKEYNISYPTVRTRIDEIITALGEKVEKSLPNRKEILQMLANGEISAEEAQRMIQTGEE